MAVTDRFGQRRQSIPLRFVHLRSIFQQEAHAFGVTISCRNNERQQHHRLLVRIGSRLQNYFHFTRRPKVCCVTESSCSKSVSRIWVGPRFLEQRNKGNLFVEHG